MISIPLPSILCTIKIYKKHFFGNDELLLFNDKDMLRNKRFRMQATLVRSAYFTISLN